MTGVVRAVRRALGPWSAWRLADAFRAVRRIGGPERAARRDFRAFRRAYGRVLGAPVPGAPRATKRALVVGTGFPASARTQLTLIKGLELAGFSTTVVTQPVPIVPRYYALARVERVTWWSEFLDAQTDRNDPRDATLTSMAELVDTEWRGIRIGRIAAATALRAIRAGSLDFERAQTRRFALEHLRSSRHAAIAADEILDRTKPDFVLFGDRGYTPQGQLFESAVRAGADVVTWNAAHRSNLLLLKRYDVANRDVHPASLSEPSWKSIQALPWSEERAAALAREVRDPYLTGDWYSEVGTQFNKRVLSGADLTVRLGLEPGRKTAVIFPHILWDGTFFWGDDLFSSYEEWLVETVRAACRNRDANWIINIHPANVVKNARDGRGEEPAEATVLRERIGTLPAHVKVLGAGSDVSTLSLLDVADACLTVRGTVGIEAAVEGIPVLTAGTGRYDRHGFTIDSASRDEYLATLARIHELPPMSEVERELARRFAYGVFVLRPLPLSSMTLQYRQDALATPDAQMRIARAEDWATAPDLNAFAAWVNDRGAADYLQARP